MQALVRYARAPPKYDTLVLSGGGVRGVALLGAVSGFKDRDRLQLRTIVGTSSGALVGAIIATNDRLDTVLQKFPDPAFKSSIDVGKLLTEYGIDDGSGLDRVMGSLLPSLTTTFRDVFEARGVRLVIVATDLDARKPAYLSVDTCPDLPIAVAVRASCAVPLYFRPVKINGTVYVDGSVSNNFACEWALAHPDARRVLGICIAPRGCRAKSLMAHIAAVIETSCYRRCLPIPDKLDVLELSIDIVSSFEFNAPNATLTKLYDAGRHAAATHIKKRV